MLVVQGGGQLEVGKVYDCHHSRKGTFRMRVDSIDGEWISGIVADGVAEAAMSYNFKHKGDKITVRDIHSYFIPVAEQPTESQP